MGLIIDNDELKRLLESHKDEIGQKYSDGIGNVISGILAIIAGVTSAKWRYPIITGGIIVLIWGVCGMANALMKRYDTESLYKDIKGLNKISHPFSIVAIKDTFNEYPNRFLTVYEKRWRCNLFLSFRTSEQEDVNIRNIKKGLSNQLKLKEDQIILDFKTEELQPKFSESDKYGKLYDHKLYLAEIQNFNDTIKHDQFTIDGTDYRWMTIQEMESDKNISKKNSDVIDMVKTFIP